MSQPEKIGRREALKWIAGAAAVPAVGVHALAQNPGAIEAPAPNRSATDPDLLKPSVPWARILSDAELATVSALCDVIIPADDQSPSASAVGVPDFINEWVSAPYPEQEADRVPIRGGLTWLNTESNRRFTKPFAELSAEQKQQICDDIAYVPNAKPGFEAAALFFARFRDLTATGFYTTREGMKDLQYIGNVPLATFDGPPPNVLEKLGLSPVTK